MDWSGEYFWSSRDLPLLTKFSARVNVDASGPDILAALIIIIYASNFEILDKVKYKLAAPKLSDFLGDDVEL